MSTHKTQYKVGDLVKYRHGDHPPGIVLEVNEVVRRRSTIKVYWFQVQKVGYYHSSSLILISASNNNE